MIKLKGNNFNNEEIYSALKEGRLLTLTIFLENICNFKCPFCLTQTREFKDELNTEETKRIIIEGKELGVQTIMIAGAGEPLMASNFWEIIDFISSLNLNIIVFSNLSLITEETAQKLYQKEVSIIAKFNSFKKDVQELYIGGVEGAFEKMQDGLQNLMNLGFNIPNEKGETRLCFETSILRQNIGELFEYWKYCRTNNIYPIIDTIYYQGKAIESEYDEFLVDYDLVLTELRKINAYDRELGIQWPIKLLNHNGKGVLVGELNIECVKIGTNLNVDIEGNVYDCFNMSEKEHGNIRENSLIEIWKTKQPYKDGICVHGLCKCRDYIDREYIYEQLPCQA